MNLTGMTNSDMFRFITERIIPDSTSLELQLQFYSLKRETNSNYPLILRH